MFEHLYLGEKVQHHDFFSLSLPSGRRSMEQKVTQDNMLAILNAYLNFNFTYLIVLSPDM
jgi:hypothetical protein